MLKMLLIEINRQEAMVIEITDRLKTTTLEMEKSSANTV
jgi:hypothetical protein